MAEEFDVIVIRGGPAGSLCAALLRRYTPTMRVALIERDAFPRYHIGESFVLEVNRILQDAGVLEIALPTLLEKLRMPWEKATAWNGVGEACR